MKENNFVWTDLSSYRPEKTTEFYKELFDWHYENQDWYYIAFNDADMVSWLYQTPEIFKELNMPHFWMGYIQVDNVEEVVAKARDLWAIIEIEKADFYNWNIALIRDPLWSWFTVYDWDWFEEKSNKLNSHIFSELHISDISKVKNFYTSIFSWAIENHGNDIFWIYNSSWKHIWDIHEISNLYKWKYEYWVQSFKVENLEEKKKKVTDLWWHIVSEEEGRALVTDDSEEAFFYITETN